MRRIAEIEKATGKPIRQAVTDALSQSTTMVEAADRLGVRKPTLYNWIRTLGIKVETRRDVVVSNASGEVA